MGRSTRIWVPDSQRQRRALRTAADSPEIGWVCVAISRSPARAVCSGKWPQDCSGCRRTPVGPGAGSEPGIAVAAATRQPLLLLDRWTSIWTTAKAKGWRALDRGPLSRNTQPKCARRGGLWASKPKCCIKLKEIGCFVAVLQGKERVFSRSSEFTGGEVRDQARSKLFALANRVSPPLYTKNLCN